MELSQMNIAKNAEVIKLEKENDKVEGKFLSCEQSALYPDSWALRIDTDDGQITTFVNVIVKDKLVNESIKQGQYIAIVYKGLKKSERTGREYKMYDLYYQ